ncbi:MAG: GatB/YqeY domain-containing protein, partial [Bacteroidota bacterium]
MTLKEKVAADLQRAMKAGDRTRLETLRSVRAALLEKEKERGAQKDLSPDVELGVLTAAAKKRRESIEMFQKGGRDDLVEQEKSELAIIQEYLPKQLSEEELKETIKAVIAETGATSESDFGNVMPPVMKLVKGKADGRLVQE